MLTLPELLTEPLRRGWGLATGLGVVACRVVGVKGGRVGGFGVRARLSTLGAFVVLLACWVLLYCCCCWLLFVADGCCLLLLLPLLLLLALLKIDKTNCRCRAVLLMSPEPENVLFVLCDFADLFLFVYPFFTSFLLLLLLLY